MSPTTHSSLTGLDTAQAAVDPPGATRLPAQLPARIPPRAGLWLSYATLLRWSAAQIGAMLPMIVIVQVLLAIGVIVGFGLLIPDIDTPTAQFLATGAPTVLLVITGFVMVPQGVTQARTSGTLGYQRALPVPRPLLLVAELTMWIAVSLPGVAVALLFARWRYDFGYSFDWAVLLAAALLTTLTAATVGYAIAVTLPPMITQLVSQVLVFFVLLFSPVTFPENRLPEWFQAMHDFLPFRPAADLIRSGLLAGDYTANLRDWAVVLVWCVVGTAISVRAITRRG